MNWVDWLLRQLKKIVILILVIGTFFFWLSVPDYKLNEPEVKNASQSSK